MLALYVNTYILTYRFKDALKKKTKYNVPCVRLLIGHQ